MKKQRKIVPVILAASLIIMVAVGAVFFLPRFTKYHLPLSIHLLNKGKAENPKERSPSIIRIKQKAAKLRQYCSRNGFSTQYGFIADMHLHSGKRRFFVYDFQKDTIVLAGMVAHGSCNEVFLTAVRFSNTSGCGCSSAGKYKVGGIYKGRFGTAYKLHGLDTTNSNAYDRNIVLHAYDCIPDNEFYPYPICNSLGCAMVSYHFLETLSGYIRKSKKPLVLWLLQ